MRSSSGPPPEQLAGLVQLLDPGRQCSQERRKPLGPLLAIYLVMLSHGYLEGVASPSVKFRYIRPIKIMSGRQGGSGRRASDRRSRADPGF